MKQFYKTKTITDPLLMEQLLHLMLMHMYGDMCTSFGEESVPSCEALASSLTSVYL